MSPKTRLCAELQTCFFFLSFYSFQHLAGFLYFTTDFFFLRSVFASPFYFPFVDIFIHSNWSLCLTCATAAAVIVPLLSGREFVAAAPLRAEPVIAGVLSQIPSESVWRQDCANCILSALLHLNNKRRTFLSEKKKRARVQLERDLQLGDVERSAVVFSVVFLGFFFCTLLTKSILVVL